MCLILLAFQAHPDFGVLLAGNRDEFKRRPSVPPELTGVAPRVWAGRDLEAGGTWMGRNDAGLMAALTNRRQPGPEPENPRSRGEIVTGVLGNTSPQDAARRLAELPLERYRPFSLLFGTKQEFFFFGPGESPHPRSLAPGFYALSNSTLDDASWPKVARSHDFFRRHRHLGWERLLEELRVFLADPSPPDDLPHQDLAEEIHGAMGAVFIRHDLYGTVSSTIFTSGGAAGERYEFAEGEALAQNPATAFWPVPLDGV